MRNLLLGGLLLPLKLYFQPYKFRAEVAALAPDLPDGYSLCRRATNGVRPNSGTHWGV